MTAAQRPGGTSTGRILLAGLIDAIVAMVMLTVLNFAALGDPLIVLGYAIVSIVGFLAGVSAALVSRLTRSRGAWAFVLGGVAGGVITYLSSVIVVLPAPALLALAGAVVTGVSAWAVVGRWREIGAEGSE